jgi:AcrR family transcriptional regulator
MRLGLARGSTSYYYRTRHALVSAAIAHLSDRSRAYFDDAVPAVPPATIEEATIVIVSQLEVLLAERRRDVLARYALMADAMADSELQQGLAKCLFSIPSATDLMTSLGAPDPADAARNLVGLLEGLIFTHAFGADVTGLGTSSDTPAAALRGPVQTWIEALVVHR